MEQKYYQVVKQEVHDIDGPPVTGTPVGSRIEDGFHHYDWIASLNCFILFQPFCIMNKALIAASGIVFRKLFPL